MSVIHAQERPPTDPRLYVFPVALGAAFAVIFIRLWWFQVVKSAVLTESATASREMAVPKPAPRGLMYDRNGMLVAGVRPEIVVTAIPAVVSQHPEVLDQLAALLKTDRKKLQQRVDDGNWRKHLPVPIFTGADIPTGSRIAEAGESLPGIGVDAVPMRYYPDTRSFTHVLGYVWVPSESDVKRISDAGRTPADYVGKQGVEKSYEMQLMGTAGDERMEVDVRRRPIRLVGRDSATPGDQLRLTLDGDLQAYATQLMANLGKPGSVVALDPKTGEVLCMVSSPTFDQSVFQGGISTAEWDALSTDPRIPMLNRAVQTALAPGSTFKLVTSIAAAENGLFNPNETVFCNGGFTLGRKTFKCLGHHGSISFQTAMEKSCNTYFATLGYRLGREKLVKAAEEVGLGERTGIEIGGEVRGDLPNDRWLKRSRKPAVWYGGDAINASLGQGAVATTPIQMANIAALVANRGVNYVPHLVHSVRDSSGKVSLVNPVESHHVNLPPEFWDQLNTALVRVVGQGTGTAARVANVEVAGKTGSAEHAKAEKTHGWFVGYAPADNPVIAIAVRVEAAGHGGEVAAPVAGAILNRYLGKAARKAAMSRATVASLTESPTAR